MDEPINQTGFGLGLLSGVMVSSMLWAVVTLAAYGLGGRELEAYRHRVAVHLSEDARGQAMHDRCVARLAMYEPLTCAER